MQKETPDHTDFPVKTWIARLPAHWQPYARLMRLDRPIGIWLLLYPCWWGSLLAWRPEEDGIARLVGHLILFALGAIIMRSAGCIANDLADRKIDPLVARTRNRPLSAGTVTPHQAAMLMGALFLLGGLILIRFNAPTIALGLAAIPLVFLYPFAKRFTHWPQLFLGLAFNWGILLGVTALRETGTPAGLLLYMGGVFWTLGYDTIYACQDTEDDFLIGVNSTALLLGDHVKPAIGGFYGAFILLMLTSAHFAGFSWAETGLFLPAAGHLIWQGATLSPTDPENCLHRFRSNAVFGGLVTGAFFLENLF